MGLGVDVGSRGGGWWFGWLVVLRWLVVLGRMGFGRGRMVHGVVGGAWLHAA